ncbi:hypothetical protein Dacet_2528 [Denitrovibrio acetiphilus DSM 12809]|uniref:TPR repeat-containing protein n=1 Tax=Denitrovibrio acetiphilus (strain DSM 12809 / NBRC 114555 / N2460) TaxID=522772 RepID=D4H4F9_DENA2|nr:outer membrane beta-barrel protein [Denitrovibrio acetiphilus]ADD69288.1 hypothetical protein Dacet_2528 [Denitrovibrio acetiphilus DSM 12809]
MHLLKGYKKILFALVLSFSSLSFAYEYPVVGEYSRYYDDVFRAVKDGKCESMDAELKALYDNEGVSPAIYVSICYFEKKDDKAYDTLSMMLSQQEYDEVLYVVEAEQDKGNHDARLLKYRGLAYYNVGALNPAVNDLEEYLTTTSDTEALYSLADIKISLRDFNGAEAVLERSPSKDGDYYYRKGRVEVFRGNNFSAVKNLRMVDASAGKIYNDANLLIGDICTSSKRYYCAEKQYRLVGSSEEYAASAQEKMEKLEKSKKRFSGFFSLGGQYDSNVTSVDEDELAGASEVSSLRLYAVADLRINFYPAFADSLTVGTMHYGTSNENIHDYDMSMHKVYFQMKHSYDSFEVMLPKITASVIDFGGEKYSTTVTAEAYGAYKLDNWTFTVPVKLSRVNYTQSTSSDDLSKDGYKYEGALEVSRRFLQKYTAKVKAGYGHDEAEGKYKVKDDTMFDASISMRLLPRLIPTLAFSYANYDYSNIDREDDYYSYSLKAIYVLTPNVFLGAGMTFTKTDSTNDVYDYTKTVSEVSVSYAF